MDNVVIRRVKAADAPAIAALWTKLVAHHRAITEDLPDSAPNGAGRYAKRVLQHLDDPQTCGLVAEINGAVVGFALGMVVDLLPDIFAPAPCGLIADIFVDIEVRRQGIGRALVDTLRAWFLEQGLQHFEWHVAAQNRAAVAFWQSIGGREVMIRMRGDLR